jgi:small subunit ribosomal protein S19
MPRSLEEGSVRRRPPAVQKVDVQNEKNTKNVIKTWSRLRSIIIPDMHRSHHRRARRSASRCRCSSPRPMVGHKLGEFAPTRTFKGHVKDDRKAKRK